VLQLPILQIANTQVTKSGLGVGQDEEDRSRKPRLLIDDLHALECVEGMGKWAFSPQGVRAPVLFVRVKWFHFRRNISAAMKRTKTTEMTPFMVKKAALSLLRSSGLTRECS
jgi:hypothetical protein